jgi:hypothetical protein
VAEPDEGSDAHTGRLQALTHGANPRHRRVFVHGLEHPFATAARRAVRPGRAAPQTPRRRSTSIVANMRTSCPACRSSASGSRAVQIDGPAVPVGAAMPRGNRISRGVSEITASFGSTPVQDDSADTLAAPPQQRAVARASQQTSVRVPGDNDELLTGNTADAVALPLVSTCGRRAGSRQRPCAHAQGSMLRKALASRWRRTVSCAARCGKSFSQVPRQWQARALTAILRVRGHACARAACSGCCFFGAGLFVSSRAALMRRMRAQSDLTARRTLPCGAPAAPASGRQCAIATAAVDLLPGERAGRWTALRHAVPCAVWGELRRSSGEARPALNAGVRMAGARGRTCAGGGLSGAWMPPHVSELPTVDGIGPPRRGRGVRRVAYR